VFEPYFSEYSYGFRPNRDCHGAIGKVLEYLNEGYEWVVDFDIEKYFDTVNHDKLISTLRERVKDDKTLHLIREYLKAGAMEDGLVKPTTEGVPQGGPLSPILSNVYLDKLDKILSYTYTYKDKTGQFTLYSMWSTESDFASPVRHRMTLVNGSGQKIYVQHSDSMNLQFGREKNADVTCSYSYKSAMYTTNASECATPWQRSFQRRNTSVVPCISTVTFSPLHRENICERSHGCSKRYTRRRVRKPRERRRETSQKSYAP